VTSTPRASASAPRAKRASGARTEEEKPALPISTAYKSLSSVDRSTAKYDSCISSASFCLDADVASNRLALVGRRVQSCLVKAELAAIQ